jgi:hypothetical protein
MSRSNRVSLFSYLLAIKLMAIPVEALCATVVTGRMKDATTDTPIGGVELIVQLGEKQLGAGLSDQDGVFQVSFEINARPEAQNLVLLTRSARYVDHSIPFQVTQGRANPDSHLLELVPKAVAACIRMRNHSVVVGYFRPPTSTSGDRDLAPRISEALEYDLSARLQQARLPQSSQPAFLACGDARPQAAGDFTHFAKVLNADAFVSGYVDQTAPKKAKVHMRIADRNAQLVPPLSASTKDVNLDDPALTRLDQSAHAAIFVALVSSYERAGNAADCIDFIAAVGRILTGPMPRPIVEAKKRCEAAVPNSGLLRRESP